MKFKEFKKKKEEKTKDTVIETKNQTVNNLNNGINLAMPLRNFVPQISSRACYALARAGINTLGELISKTALEVLNVKHIGDQLFNEILNFVHSLGFEFKEGSIEMHDDVVVIQEKIEIQTKENDDIAREIIIKKQLLNRYYKLIETKEKLLKQEQELNNEITRVLEQLTKIVGEQSAQKVK